jgi:hypothetical protein
MLHWMLALGLVELRVAWTTFIPQIQFLIAFVLTRNSLPLFREANSADYSFGPPSWVTSYYLYVTSYLMKENALK